MLILGLAGAFAFIRYKVPVYRVTAAIMIKDEKKGIDDSKMLEQLNLFGAKRSLKTKSRSSSQELY